jgi:hypothetical protein
MLLAARGQTEVLLWLADNGAGGEARIERELGVLEHDLHAPTVLPHRAWGQPGHVDAAKSNSAGRRFDQFQHNAAQRGFDTTQA